MLRESQVTSQSVYLNRRHFMLTAGGGIGSGLLLSDALACSHSRGRLRSGEAVNTRDEIVSYNNYYEFSTNKEAVRHLAKSFRIRPWTLSVEGEVDKPAVFELDDLLTRWPSEQRIYRLRCVEGWSMVVPWNGFGLCHLLKHVQPTSRAKFVEFESVFRPEEMIGQRHPTLAWPYREALTIDEATHPLTFIASGLYDDDLPAQNGAPLRLVVPWKYGFKSAKAIVRIRLLEHQPTTSWSIANPSEYGFYANVNPDVAHPRWSQAREVRIGEIKKRETLVFNGYADEVARLYQGLDLKRHF